MPSASTTSRACRFSTVRPNMMLRMPAELLPIAPPTALWLEVAGSGANISPSGASSMLSRSMTTPGSTHARRPAASTEVTRRQWAPRSTTTAAFTAWPFRLVPPPRGSTGTPLPAHHCTTRTASSTSCGTTARIGSTW